MNKNKKIIFLNILLASCFTPPQKTEMIVYQYVSAQIIGESLFVRGVVGGKQTIPFGWGRSTIQNEDFREVLRISLENANLFTALSDGSNWALDIEIEYSLENWFWVRDAKLHTNIKYIFLFNNQKKCELIVKEVGEKNFSDEFFSEIRIRKAMELSVKNNVQEFLRRVSNTKFHSNGNITTDIKKAIYKGEEFIVSYCE